MGVRPTLDPSDAVRFVLAAPRSAGNVGAAARALKNLGFRRLVLVAPECDPVGNEARSMAVDAADVLENAHVVASLDRALAGAGTVVGTTRRRGKARRPHFRLDEISPALTGLAGASELAFVFGCEPHGLSDAELDRCTHLVHFLASDEYPSFNLGQSVLLVAYEFRRALASRTDNDAPGALADHDAREAMYAHLREALHAADFLHDESADGKMRRLRRILGRAALTEGDVRVLRGIARQLLWLAEQAAARR